MATAPEWVRFDGVAEDNGTTYTLRAYADAGIVVLDKSHVRLHDEFIDVRVGANATVTRAPTGQRPASAPRPLFDDPCDGRGTFCLGRVEFCCGDGKVVGP